MAEDDKAPLPADLSSVSDPMKRSPICVKCSHDLLMCKCTGGQAHGENVAFMCADPLPADATVRQHLGRFVSEAEAHPVLQGQLPMRRFVNDYLAKGLLQTMRDKESLVREMMSAYQAMPEFEELLAMIKGDRATLEEDCSDMLENLFKGAWYLPSKLQLVLMINAFQLGDKSRFPQSDTGLQMIFEVVDFVLAAYRMVSKEWHFCLELRKED